MTTPPPDRYERAPRLPAGDSIDLRALVRHDGPLELEIGPGRGMFLRERVLAAPESAVIGLEIRRKWATLVDERLSREGLGDRARVFAEDAKEALPRLGPSGSLARAYVLFPDPWWKKRHTKRLVIGELLLQELARLLAPNGDLFIQTDVTERAAEYTAAVAELPAFEPHGDVHGSPALEANPYGARTNREKRADEDGLPVHRMRWRRSG